MSGQFLLDEEIRNMSWVNVRMMSSKISQLSVLSFFLSFLLFNTGNLKHGNLVHPCKTKERKRILISRKLAGLLEPSRAL